MVIFRCLDIQIARQSRRCQPGLRKDEKASIFVPQMSDAEYADTNDLIRKSAESCQKFHETIPILINLTEKQS
jgi:hypothetical protein